MIEILYTTILVCLTVIGVVCALIFATGFLYGLTAALLYMMFWTAAWVLDRVVAIRKWFNKRTIETNDDWN